MKGLGRWTDNSASVVGVVGILILPTMVLDTSHYYHHLWISSHIHLVVTSTQRKNELFLNEVMSIAVL